VLLAQGILPKPFQEFAAIVVGSVSFDAKDSQKRAFARRCEFLLLRADYEF